MNKLPENITPELIAAYFNGETGSEQSAILQEWINSSPANKKYFEDLKRTWEETGKLDPAPVMVDTDKAWAKLSSRIEPARTIKRFPINAYMRVAAMLLPPVLIIAFYLFSQANKKLELATTSSTINYTLPDSSKIVMNEKTKLTYPKRFSGKNREVTLNGEAFFDVAHDSAKPFIIHSGDANVKVLGTSFNVKAYADSTNVEVYVKTGRVMLSGNDENSYVILEAGDKGIFNKETHLAARVEELSSDEIFWMNRTLIFSKTELGMVAEVLNRCYHVKILMNNKELMSCRLTATFMNQPIDTIIEVIAKSFNLKVTKTDATYQLDGDGC